VPTQLTPEISQWVHEQLSRGCLVEEMIEAMIAVGHPPGAAREIIITAAARQRGAAAGTTAAARAALDAPEARLSVPEPLPDGDTLSVVTPDRVVPVLAQLRRPRVIVFGSVLSGEECDALIRESTPKLERSRTVDRASGLTELNAARTSEGTYFQHDESPLLRTINARIAALTRWPLVNGEPLQILHYGVGAQYLPHYDYFDLTDPGTPVLVARGGQRVATLIIYLNDPEAGGATTFPDIGFEVVPKRGNAVFFSYDHPHAETLTLHSGAPLAAGEKWIATRWMRERAYL
jgi:prolyl 4-hydroxylase